MANLSFIEQKYFEKVLEMGGGYVLDFSNNDFQNFIFDSLKIDVYEKYEYASKAKLLRRIIKDFDNKQVGKLLLELLDYKRTHLEISEEEKEDFLKCVEIGRRLIGKKREVKNKAKKNKSTNRFNFSKFKNYLNKLKEIKNPQKRGYKFEEFLHKLFLENNMDPRGSFKIIGEQIDGSFIFQNEVYLLEAKWTKKPVDKSALANFNSKVLSKSGFTRGLFISYSGYSNEALQTFFNGRNVKIILMTVRELVISFEREINFKEIIYKKIRALAEEGEYYRDIIDI